jgi:polysaccharide biosynthesis protein PslH
METLLFLAHLSHLTQRYRVFLGTFIDDPLDWPHVDVLRRMCAEVHVEAIVPWSRRMRAVAAVLAGEPLTLPYFRSRSLHRWVAEVVRRERIQQAFVFSSPMAQYVLDLPNLRSVVDFVDMDSAKWSDYARHRPWPICAFYRREGARLLRYECDVAARAAASIFVTEDEAKPLRTTLRDSAARVVTIRNGVDSVYFAPSPDRDSPFPPAERPVVFTGAMDYWPNADAAIWFGREVLPRVRSCDSAVRFYVVGMNPGAAVRELAKNDATVVTGRVDDVRPYLQHARVVVAPLRVARGLQNKVLEAMAMARPVVVTAASAAALSVGEGSEIEVASSAPEFATKVLQLLDPVRAETMGRAARARVRRDFVWADNLAPLELLLAPGHGRADTAAAVAGADVRGPVSAR